MGYTLTAKAVKKLRQHLRGTMTVGGVPQGAAAKFYTAAEMPPPYTVQWSATADDYLVFIPALDRVLYTPDGAMDVTPEECTLATPDGYPDGWYTLSSLGVDAKGADAVYLNVYSVAESEEDESETETESEEKSPHVTWTTEEGEDEKGLTRVSVQLAAMSHNDTTGEDHVTQFVNGAIILGSGGGGSVTIDEKSIDRNDENAVELAHFADAEKDSGKGLIERMTVNPETGEITSNDSELMLVARRHGEIIYIPMSGDGEDPESDDDEEKQCDHPQGGNEGVSAGDDNDDDGSGSSGGGTIGGVSGDGGVVANGDVHEGDNDCNCN